MGDDNIMDTFSTMKQLNAVLRFVGLCSVYRDGTSLRQSPSLCKIFFYIISLTFANILSLYIKFYMNGGLSSFSFKDAIHFVYVLGYFLYISDVYFVYKYRQFYLEYINTYDYIDRILGVNYISFIKSKITKTSLLFVSTDLFCNLFEYIYWVYFYGWLLPTIYSVEFIYYVFKSLSLADMVANIIQLEFRLRAIGDLLQNDDTSIALVKSINTESMDKSLDHEAYKINLATVDHDGPEIIMWITRCYLFILDQANCINTMYGCRILVASVVILKTLIMLLNIIIRLILGSLDTESQEIKYLFITSTAMRVVTRCLVTICAIYRIEVCYKQVDRIIRIIDHTFFTGSNVSTSTARALHNLRELILSRPLSFHAYNFFRLDYVNLVSISSAAVTYTIILLQNVQ